MKTLKKLVPALLALTLLAGCAGGPAESGAPGSAAPENSAAGAQGGEKVLNVGRMAELFDMDPPSPPRRTAWRSSPPS